MTGSPPDLGIFNNERTRVRLALGILNWFNHLGGAGLILLGLADNSAIPLPGSVDALTIVLAASKREWWWVYAISATIGAVVGGFLTFRLSRRGEEKFEDREQKIPKEKLKKVQRIFGKWGFVSVMIPAMLPPPVPMVPFLVNAGVRYPTRKFIAALTLGRGIRYFVFAWLGRTYGEHVIGFFSQYYRPILIVLVSLALAGVLVVLALYLRRRKRRGGETDEARRAA